MLQKKRGRLLHELAHELAQLEHSHDLVSEEQLNNLEEHVHKELFRLEEIDDMLPENKEELGQHFVNGLGKSLV